MDAHAKNACLCNFDAFYFVHLNETRLSAQLVHDHVIHDFRPTVTDASRTQRARCSYSQLKGGVGFAWL